MKRGKSNLATVMIGGIGIKTKEVFVPILKIKMTPFLFKELKKNKGWMPV